MSKPPAKSDTSADTGLALPAELEAEIDRQIGDLVQQKQRELIVKRMAMVVYAERFSGPIAHPRHLAEYEKICPGAADRIIMMAEKRNDHHMQMDRTAIDAEVKDQKLGMWMGFVALAALIAAATACVLVAESVGGAAVFLTAAAVGGVGMFIKGRNGNGNGS